MFSADPKLYYKIIRILKDKRYINNAIDINKIIVFLKDGKYVISLYIKIKADKYLMKNQFRWQKKTKMIKN